MASKLAPGKARVQYLVIREELDALLDRGETFKGAYDILVESGKITMAYESLVRLHSGVTCLRTVVGKKKGWRRNGTESAQQTVNPEPVGDAYERGSTINSIKVDKAPGVLNPKDVKDSI